VRWISWYEIF